MKRKLSAVLTLLVLLLSVATIQSASAKSPKPGQKCTKLGATQTLSGKQFTCIKSDNKLVWNKGVVLKKLPSPTPSPKISIKLVEAAQADLGFGCNNEKQEAFSLKGPLICNKEEWVLIQAENDSVQSRAYRFVLDRWNKQPEGNLTIDFYIDATSGTWVNEIERGLRAGARFWGTSVLGSKPIPAFISENPAYIEEALAKSGIKQSTQDRDRNRNARGGQAGFHGGQDAYWYFLFKTPDSRTNVGYFQVAPHEYTHYAQAQLSLNGDWGAAGPWFNEGLASFIGSALGPMSKMPHNQMDGWRSNLDFNVTTPLSFFNDTDQSVYQSSRWGDVYPLGAMATQAVVALVGIDPVISFYKDLGTSNDKESAYKKNFKLGSSQLVSVLQSYIDSIRSKKEWSLSTLETKYKEAVAKG